MPAGIEVTTGGEGGIARGRGRPLVLRFAPDRRGKAATSKNRSAIFVEPGGVVHTPCSVKPQDGAFCFYRWRRGWDSNERVQAIGINNLRVLQGHPIPSTPLRPPFLPVDSASTLHWR